MTEDRLPPFDLDAESAILSLCMIDPDAFKRASPMLRAEDFFSTLHQAIYRGCMGVHRAGGIIDVVRVAGWLKDNGLIEQAGGMAYLTDILNAAPNTFNVVNYAKTVRNKAKVRALIAECHKISSVGYGARGDDVEYLMRSGAAIREITRVADKSAMVSNVESLREVFLRIQRNCQEDKRITGMRTGLEDIDRLTTGLHGKQLRIVAARPGVGKSARLLQIADAVATAGMGVAFFSLEMTKEELAQRHIAMRASVDASRLELGQLSQEEWARVTDQVNQISQLPIMFDDTPDLTIYQVRERALGAIDDGFTAKKPIALIAVDYLQRLGIPREDRKKNRSEQIGDIARGLKELAKESGLPVVSAAQLRRIPENRPDKVPCLQDLRESGDIEAEADVVELLHRPGQNDKNKDQTAAEIIIGKSRHGRDGIVEVTWRGEYTRFDNKKEW